VSLNFLKFSPWTVRLVGKDVALSRQKDGFNSHTVQGEKQGARSIHGSIVVGSIPASSKKS
jgi:hypothetical protein